MKRFATIFVLLSILMYQTQLSAENTEKSKPVSDGVPISSQHPDLEEDEKFFADIKGLKAKLGEMRKGMRGLTGEQQLALGLQIRETEVHLRAVFGDLLDYIEEEQKTNTLKPYILPLTKSLLQEESEIIRSELEYSANYIQSLLKGQKDLDAIQLFSRKQEISKNYKIYDGLLKDFLENSNRLNFLKIPSGSDLDLLDSLLKKRALTVSSEIKLVRSKLSDFHDQYINASGESKDNIHTKIIAVEEYKDGLTESLASLIKLLQERDIDSVEYSELLFTATGQISSEIMDKEVALSLMSHWIDAGKKWIRENGLGLLLKFLLIVLLLSIFKLMAWMTERLLWRIFSTKTSRMSKLAGNFLVSISGKVVMVFGFLVALSQLGFKVGPLLAGLGIAGFIVGFALQDVLSNFASGVMILIYQPFDVGDTIEAPEVSGKVQSMNLVSTIVLTYDNQRLVVPNNKLWGNIIRNVHSEKIRRVDLVFGIAYEADIDHAEKIFQEIIEEHELVLNSPEYNIKVHNLGESSVDFIVRPWTKAENYWDVYWDITRTVKKRFDEEGISIPYPQRDVHVHHGEIAA